MIRGGAVKGRVGPLPRRRVGGGTLVGAGALPGWARPLLAVGVLGGYTTFSTFSVETLRLLTGGGSGLALLNVLGQPFVGLVAAYLGAAVVRGMVG